MDKSENPERWTRSSHSVLRWQFFFLILIFSFYIILLIVWVKGNLFISSYGSDFLAFWSVGKVIDKLGFSNAYDIQQLKSVQLQVLKDLSLFTNLESFTPLPAPYLPVFLLPFKYLSRIDAEISFWIWTILNQIALIGYLLFFFLKTKANRINQDFLLLLLLSTLPFPVFDNFVMGQLNVFLMICLGEFFRNLIRKRPHLMGIWLGGLMLKPQLLILLLPFLILERNWKAVRGFIYSAGVILLASLLLAGKGSMLSYLQLLTGWKNSNSVTAPEAMINWRMVGVYFDRFAGSPSGTIIATIGIFLSLCMAFILIRRHRMVGTDALGLTMVGLVSATLAITWHAHAHMAIVLIPFLLYAGVENLLPKTVILFWVVLTPLCWMGFGALGIFAPELAQSRITDWMFLVFAPTGFLANITVFISTLRNSRNFHVSSNLKIVAQ
jgi:hypothetical protein